MAIVITSNSGKKHYALAHFVCDTTNDIPDLPVEQVWVGSTAYIIDSGETFMFNSQKEWVKVTTEGGGSGSAGLAATIQVGEVHTGAPGSPVTIENSGTESAAIFDFSIPRGEPFQIKKIYDDYTDMNDDYDNPEINIGDLVCVTNNLGDKEIWIKGNTVYEFFISLEGAEVIKGEDGAKGEKGDKGDKGDPFIYTDFTPAQLAGLKGDTGDGIENVVDLGGGQIKFITTDGVEYTVTVPAGPQGATGPEGPQGPKGDPIAFKEVYNTTQEMEDDHDNPNIDVGDIVIVKDGKVYIKAINDWTYLFDITTTEVIEGPPGPQGPEGDEGPGISNIALDGTGKLIITIENGKTYTIDFGDIWMRKVNPVGTGTMSMNRRSGEGIGDYSTTFGYNGTAYGAYSFAEGQGTYAIGKAAHSEGEGTRANGEDSHAEGYYTWANGNQSHAEGNAAVAAEIGAHAEGHESTATGQYSHAEGNITHAQNIGAHSEGDATTAKGRGSHAEGMNSIADDYNGAHAEGVSTKAKNIAAHAEGSSTEASGVYSHAEGYKSTASGQYSHAEGEETQAVGRSSHAEGHNTYAADYDTHAEGCTTQALGHYSHAEGHYSEARGEADHAEGHYTVANGNYAHAEGQNTQATNNAAHAEGYYTQASGVSAHAEGYSTQAQGNASHAGGGYTIAKGNYQTVIGAYNIADNNNTYAEIVGGGSADNARANIRTLDWSGNETIAGKLTVGAAPTNNMDVATKQYVDNTSSLPSVTSTDNGKVLKVVEGVWALGTDSGMPSSTGWDYGTVLYANGSGGWTINNIQKITAKLNGAVIPSQYLNAGDTEVTFTNDNISSDSMVEVYTDKFGFDPIDISSTGTHSVKVTFEADTVQHQIRLVVIG